MKLIRFDDRGAMQPQNGFFDDRLARCLTEIEPIRDAMLSDTFSDTFSGNASRDALVRGLPETILRNYRLDPVGSELASIFRTANGLHEEIDAVVILGSTDLLLPARALMESLCHPHHNELTRGGRGSKPRLYFSGDDFDNDAIQALRERLAEGGSSDDPAEARWATCVISNHNQVETAVAVEQFHKFASGDPGGPKRLIPMTGISDRLQPLTQQPDCRTAFTIPDGLDGSLLMFSAVGLLPAALLGVDCVQLLEGAIAMNRHFATAAAAENMVLRHATVNHLLTREAGKTVRVTATWSRALESIGLWYNHLAAQAGIAATTVTRSRCCLNAINPEDKIFHNIYVQGCRSDPLVCEDRVGESDVSLVELNGQSYQQTLNALHETGLSTTAIVLPEIDPYTIGQLMQMLILSTLVEKSLCDASPRLTSGYNL